jgi:two-component system, cell cycle sensor histidine kinase and response regulator CckA
MLDQRMEEQIAIAVVDDNKAVGEFVAKVLRMQGHRVLEATCGAEALDAAQHYENPIDLLLTDFEMPEMDGLSLWRKVRERWPEVRVVFMSGSASPHDFDCEPFLSKPFALHELMAAVDDSLRRHHSRQERGFETNGLPPAQLNPLALSAMNAPGG